MATIFYGVLILRGEPFDETLSRYSRFWNYLAERLVQRLMFIT